jgi:deazaflavin-dependent oxidoreductase (nitroreductase family)
MAMRVVKQVRPPKGLARIFYRMPIQLYRMRLGRLLGSRLMLLHHTGRTSGLPRRTVIEVVERSGDGARVAASGFGARADWYRNVRANPEVTIETAGREFRAAAESLSSEEAAEVMARYAGRYPRAARRLCRTLMGFEVDGGESDFREVGRRVPMVRFSPTATQD